METLTIKQNLHHNINWKASLSNGETFYEDKGDFCAIENELSPWRRLIKYTLDNKCSITSLALYGGGRTFNLPSAGRGMPKFRVFETADRPIDFNFFRKYGGDLNKGQTDFESSDDFACIEAIYKDYRLQLWVDDRHSENCWVLVVKE